MSTLLAPDRSAAPSVAERSPHAWRSATAVPVVVVTAALGTSLALRLTGTGWGRWDDALTVVLLLAAVPHGSVDHLVPGWRSPRPRWPRLALLAATYAGTAAASWWLLRAFPAAGLVGFLVLSAAHFGAGETTFGRLRGTGPSSRGAAALLGSVVVLLPLVTHPEAVAPWLALMVPGWNGTVPPGSVAAVRVALVAAAATAALRWLLRGERLAAGELSLLTASALLVPPVLAIATYLGGWHAVRHTAVLLGEERLARGAGAGRRLLLRAAAPSALVLATLAVLWSVAADGDLRRFVAEDTWLLAALTVPHAGVVWWLDRTRPAAARPDEVTG